VKIAIASGKGGTGKTTLAVNLAVALGRQRSAVEEEQTGGQDFTDSREAMDGKVAVGLLDCDVEEPNCHLYLKPQFAADQTVNVLIPQVDEEACTGCGLCARVCEFNALLALPAVPLLLPELCHACGVCAYVCPNKAISEVERPVGQVGAGTVEGLYFRFGALNVGEARATPVIRAVKDLSGAPALDTVILDAPPGVACPAVETMRGADYVLLVTEPTPFGLHDLELAVEATRELGLPFGVVINRAGVGDSRVSDFCRTQNIPVLLEIPDDRQIAEACSRGQVFSATNKQFAHKLCALVSRVQAEIGIATTSGGR